MQTMSWTPTVHINTPVSRLYVTKKKNVSSLGDFHTLLLWHKRRWKNTAAASVTEGPVTHFYSFVLTRAHAFLFPSDLSLDSDDFTSAPLSRDAVIEEIVEQKREGG